MIQGVLREMLGVEPVLRGVWNANLNSPVLKSGVGKKGDWYRVSHNGFTTVDRTTIWRMGEVVYFNGKHWQGMSFGEHVEPVWEPKVTGTILGEWDPVSNQPVLKSSTGNVGDCFAVTRDGYQTLDGTAAWHAGDIAMFTVKKIWEKKSKQELDHLHS